MSVRLHRPVASDAAVVGRMRGSKVVESGVSFEQIARSQDKDASEVVKRIAGISVMDDKFIVVRGLSQRYNNTWINGAAAPGSEADSRAFSFDLIPSSQIESVTIAKSPAAEYPADFSGGFVMIRTRMFVDRNDMQLSYGTGFNSATHFRNFRSAKGSPTDFLGFDNGMRSLASFVPARVDPDDVPMVDRVTRSGFGNNDWSIRNRCALPDQRFNFAVNRSYRLKSGNRWGLSAAANYSLTSKTIRDMTNDQFGVYDDAGDRPTQIFSYRDNVYSTDARLGAMLNLSFVSAGNGNGASSRYELRNIVNQLGSNRLTEREGWRDKSGKFFQQQTEYLYQSRTTYSGQFTGDHTLADRLASRIDWSASCSYSNRYQPDRRIVERRTDPTNGINDYAWFENQRYYTALDENMFAAAANYRFKPGGRNGKTELRAGLYGDYKFRKYFTREFAYKTGPDLPSDWILLPTDQIMVGGNLGAPNRLHIHDDTDNTNNYKARNGTMAAYAAADVPVGRFDIYAGLRYEYFHTTLTGYTRRASNHTKEDLYNYHNLFPSLNVSFDLDRRSKLRFAYGMSVNRQEMRELALSSYYDFDIFSLISGNPDLKQATIHNIDLRYEFYPSSDETVSLALFDKQFRNPIEWYYMDAGGTFQFSFMNGECAHNYGFEIDARKRLDFIGLPSLMATVNFSLIQSVVHISRGGVEYDRPMQGQSPYIVNAGLVWQTQSGRLGLGAFYNRIGRRIIGVGRVQGVNGDSFNNNLPDMYETPRDMIDLSCSYRLSKTVELRAAARDILAQRVRYEQRPQFIDVYGNLQTRTQTPRAYTPGRMFQITVTANF
ncbi:MAG: outer membrane beta-barrel protein [Rikenellaceae bacterium]|nr:outer membrane beta-barrel protein [Rikenellaceae bacterium]